MHISIRRRWSLILSVFALVGMLPLAGCIAHAPGSGGGSQNTTVTISPTSASVGAGSTQNFTATVTGPTDTAVTWNVNGTQNGNSTVGTIAPGTCGTTLCAVYTAPATVPSPASVSVTAVSVANGTTSSAAAVTVTASNVQVSLTPTTTTVDAGATANFTATVTGTNNVAVNWLVNGNPNGNSNVGTITATATSTGSSAVYTAPATAPGQSQNITIMAQSQADALASASATATLPPILVGVTPASGTQIGVGTTQQFTATVSGTTNNSLTWQVNSINGGDSTNGTISATGLYTAPAMLPSSVTSGPFPVTITASLTQAGVTYSGQASANVHVVVTVSPAVDSIGQGANLQYTATVAGVPAASQGVQWSATSAGASGGGAFDNPLNNDGLYIAPQLVTGQTSAAVTVTATSVFDNTAFGTANLTVEETDPLGKVSNVTTLPSSSCPADSNGGLANGTCYSMTVSCDDVADITAYMKVNTPPAGVTPAGTVLFLIGSGGSGLYDDNPLWQYGYSTVETVNATFNTVQISFGAPFNTNQPNGWLQGPGGVRRLACRYATLADWVYNNPNKINSSSTGTTSSPMCATGNSGGSGAVAYAAFEYGLAGVNTTGPAQEFSMIEPSSGPPMTRLDSACVCNNSQNGPADECTGSVQSSMCYTPSEASIIDPAYQVAGESNQPTLCSQGLSGSNNTQAVRFLSDSIDYGPTKSPAIPLNKNLTVIMRFGGLDTTTAVPQGMTFWGAAGPTPAKPLCTNDAPHDIPSVADGAANIANDIITNCH